MIQQMKIDGGWETSRRNMKQMVFRVLDENPALRSSTQKRLVMRMYMKKLGMGYPVSESDFWNLIEDMPTIDRYIRDYIEQFDGR